MAEPILNQGFSESRPTGPVVASGGPKVGGLLSARIGSSHRFAPPRDVGRVSRGIRTLNSVQALHRLDDLVDVYGLNDEDKQAARDRVRSGLRWVCSNRSCEALIATGNIGWVSKRAAIEAHPTKRDLEKEQDMHVLFAWVALPAVRMPLQNLFDQKRGAFTETVVTMPAPHNLSFGDLVKIEGVKGRPLIGGIDPTDRKLDKLVGLIGRLVLKDSKNKELEALLTDEDPAAGVLSELPINGDHMVAPASATSFIVARDIGGTVVLDKDVRPTVTLHPERVTLLSDEE